MDDTNIRIPETIMNSHDTSDMADDSATREDNTSTVQTTKNRGVSRNSFSHDEMIRIQSQWNDDLHQGMRGKQDHGFKFVPQDKEEVIPAEAGMLRRSFGYARQWIVQRESLRKKAALAEQVERQRYILQAEARSYVLNQMVKKVQSTPGPIRKLMKVGSPEKTASGDGITVKVVYPPVSDDTPTKEETTVAIEDDTPTDVATADNNDRSNDDINDNTAFIKINIMPEPPSKYPFCPHILSARSMKKIASEGIPASVIFSRWKRVYSLARDGDCFEAMLRLVKGDNKTLLVVKTTRGELFGGYVGSTWESQHSKSVGGAFYGDGTAFLFKMDHHRLDNEERGDGDEEEGEYQGEAKVFKWTGMNRYIQICELSTKKIAMGGGGLEGSFGLCLEDDFRRGSTGRCDTFGNDPLADQEQFDIMDLEIWGFATGVF